MPHTNILKASRRRHSNPPPRARAPRPSPPPRGGVARGRCATRDPSQAEKQILIYKGKKMDDDSASLESYGMAADPSLRKQSITVTDH